MTRLFADVPKRALVLLAALAALLIAAPFLVDSYILTVLVTALWFAYVGQAWNVMMGFAGQLSLGHSLYVGLGAYTAAALYLHFGIGPWAGLFLAMAFATLAGTALGSLGFRFGIRGVYFALLTIAFAEFTRIAFDHFGWVGSSGGFFLPVVAPGTVDIFNLRGSTRLFYFVALAMTGLALLVCKLLLHSRIGYQWLAIREDQEAAQAVGINVFRAKLTAVMISAAMTSLAGVFYAFFYNNLFPEQIFAMSRSVEILLPVIVGGIGTLFGPIFGAFVLTPLSEVLIWAVEHAGIVLPGTKQVIYGVALVVIILFRPAGLWPAIARRLGLESRS